MSDTSTRGERSSIAESTVRPRPLISMLAQNDDDDAGCCGGGSCGI